jgi:hypothetical protein
MVLHMCRPEKISYRSNSDGAVTDYASLAGMIRGRLYEWFAAAAAWTIRITEKEVTGWAFGVLPSHRQSVEDAVCMSVWLVGVGQEQLGLKGQSSIIGNSNINRRRKWEDDRFGSCTLLGEGLGKAMRKWREM